MDILLNLIVLAKNCESSNWLETLIKLSGPIAILISVILGYFFNRTISQTTMKVQLTKQFIDEFYSKEFMDHRISIWKTKEKILTSEVSMKYIAVGYNFPLKVKSCYKGEDVLGYTEHQHITMYLGFIKRLSYALEMGDIELKYIKNALEYQFFWCHNFFMQMKKCGEELHKERQNTMKNVPLPYYIKSMDIINEKFQLNDFSESEEGINETHFEYKTHEEHKI